AARLPELQGRPRVLVDKGLLDGGLLRLETGDDAHEALVELTQAIGEVAFGVRRHKSARHVGEAHAVGFDDTPSRPAQARIYADDANRLSAHGARYHVGARRILLIAKCLPQWMVGHRQRKSVRSQGAAQFCPLLAPVAALTAGFDRPIAWHTLGPSRICAPWGPAHIIGDRGAARPKGDGTRRQEALPRSAPQRWCWRGSPPPAPGRASPRPPPWPAPWRPP